MERKGRKEELLETVPIEEGKEGKSAQRVEISTAGERRRRVR